MAAATQKQRPRHRARNPKRDTYIGLIVLAVGVLAFYLSLTKQIPFVGQGGRLVKAEFSEPNQIESGVTPVRVDGIDVGTVSSVNVQHGGRYGQVVMRITNGSIRLHSDASAQLKFRTLLGANFVVDLDPGSPSAPPLGPAGIPRSHTSVQSEWDDILRVFSGNTPASTRVDLKQLAAAVKAPQLGTVIDTLAPALAPVPAAFRALQGQDPGDLAGLVQSASRTVKTLGDAETSLQNLISGAGATVQATAAEAPALGRTLAEAPGALAATVSVAHSVEQTLPPLDTLIAALGPGATALGPAAAAADPAVHALRTVLNRTRPLLQSLRPAIAQLSAASGPGSTLVAELQPTVTRLNQQLIPWLQSNDSDLKRPIYTLIGPTFAALGSAASEYDDHAHVIHFPISPEADSATLVPCTLFVGAPSASQVANCASLNQILSIVLGGTASTGSARRGG
jgi:virulence factor Mce-like protein